MTASMEIDSAELLDGLGDGPAAAPRDNGELVFAAPWEGRAFGLALSLVDRGLFSLDDLQAELIVAVGEWEALGRPSEDYRYYECWLVALERLVERTTELGLADIDERSDEFMARPPGHDHHHHHHADADHPH